VTPPSTALYRFPSAAARVLYLATNHPGNLRVAGLLLVLVAILALVIVVYGVAPLLFRGLGEGMLPALVTFVVVAWLFTTRSRRPS
jgi:Na+-driven multidrug efflux pump